MKDYSNKNKSYTPSLRARLVLKFKSSNKSMHNYLFWTGMLNEIGQCERTKIVNEYGLNYDK